MKILEKKFVTKAFILALLLSTQTLYGFEDRPDKPHMNKPNGDMDIKSHILERFDKDGDGQISKEEAHGGMAHNFSKHDLDGDGYISSDEEFDTLPKHPPRRGEGGERPSPQH